MGKSYERWMQQLKETSDANTLMLRELVIPGTHDSATATLSTKSEFSPDCILHPYTQKLMNWFPRTTKQIVVDWAKAQTLSIVEQLEMGIRYFDLRLALHPISNKLHACHSLFDLPICDILKEINIFLTKNRNEIVLLDFQHFYKIYDKKIYHAFADNLLRIFGKKIAPPSHGQDVTLGDLWTTSQQVIILHSNLVNFSNTPYDKFFWKRENFLDSPWPNKTNVGDLENSLRHIFRQRRMQKNNKFFVLQGVLTPDLDMIKKGVGHSFTGNSNSLKCLALRTNSAVIHWLSTACIENPNIVIMDFVELTQHFLPLTLHLNREKIKKITAPGYKQLNFCVSEPLLQKIPLKKKSSLNFEIIFFLVTSVVILTKLPIFLLWVYLLTSTGIFFAMKYTKNHKKISVNLNEKNGKFSSQLNITKMLEIDPINMTCLNQEKEIKSQHQTTRPLCDVTNASKEMPNLERHSDSRGFNL